MFEVRIHFAETMISQFVPFVPPSRLHRFGAAGPPSPLRGFGAHLRVGLPTVAHALEGRRERRWAHQDSNLERTGYEPVALTVELWAHIRLSPKA